MSDWAFTQEYAEVINKHFWELLATEETEWDE
jgi:hypothetical protein